MPPGLNELISPQIILADFQGRGLSQNMGNLFKYQYRYLFLNSKYITMENSLLDLTKEAIIFKENNGQLNLADPHPIVILVKVILPWWHDNFV